MVVSNVKRMIPEQAKTWWAEYRSREGVEKAADGVEAAAPPVPTTTPEEAKAAGWGVEEADQRKAKEGASEFLRVSQGCGVVAANIVDRPGDTTRARIRHPQELHLCAGAADGRHPAQGRQSAQGLGLGDWQEEGASRAGGVIWRQPTMHALR